MTHFVRPLALAEGLDPAEFDVHFHAPSRFHAYLAGKNFHIGLLDSMPGEQFLANLARGAPLFPLETLRRYVKEDRELISQIRPDLVIGDMRLSLPLSARLENVKSAVIMNAYWSPYAKRRSIIPELPITRIVPPRFLGPIYRFTEPFAFAIHVAGMNRLRKEFGLPPLPPDLRVMYTEGNYVLYPDVPEFVPTDGAPSSHRYVGVCEWTVPMPKPEWWGAAMADRRPRVFVSLGSSGAVRIMADLWKALSAMPVAVLISNSGRDVGSFDRGAYLANLLPFTETAAACDLVISHGGSGGLYPAMAAGTPVLGVPSNADQQLSAAILEENGAGLGVRAEEASAKRLRSAVERILAESKFRTRARGWAATFAKYNSVKLFRDFLAGAGLKPNR